MTFKETGFRAFYHQICALELNDKLREIIKDCPDAAKSSHAVVYGYIDSQKGLMLEVLGGGKQAPKYFYFKDPYEDGRITIQAAAVDDVDFVYFEKLEPRFRKKYEAKIELLKQYDAPEDVEESRSFGFLDECREPHYPDDVKVHFKKNGLKTEICWVRITGLGDHCFKGKVLNQPNQDFGCNKGDNITFYVQKTEEERVICVIDFTPEITAENLADGSVLKNAISDYYKNKSDETVFFVFTVLRNSKVISPYTIEGTEQAKQVLKVLKEEDRELTEEEQRILQEETDMLPCILGNEEGAFLAVFSNESEMGERFKDAAIGHVSFMDAVKMAKDDDELKGIVVNAFSEPFVVYKDVFGAIEKCPQIVDDSDCVPAEMDSKPEKENPYDFSKKYGIGIDVRKADVFNFALYQNNIAPVSGIRIVNVTEDPIKDISLRITSDYQFFEEYERQLPAIRPGKPVNIPNPKLVINGNLLAGMEEAVTAAINVELYKDGERLCGKTAQMQVFAYNQWQGGDTYRDLLPAFVLPNHPVIPMLMHEAADRLRKWGKDPSFEGYQSHDPNRVRELAAAAFAAIQKKNIIYAEPPKSAFLSVPGQRIRTPEIIMEQRLGTCMDMTLLYAACLESMGLHPLLVLLKGHIFAGVWLRERTLDELKSGNVIIDSFYELHKRFGTGTDELTFVECTAMCSGKEASYEDAEYTAKAGNLSDPEAFECAIDVFVSRINGVRPIASRVKDSGNYQINAEEIREADITEAPEALDITIIDTVPKKERKISNKKELWESKLLDLSPHNMLLNLPLNASVEPVMSSHIDELEDTLSDGHEFHLLPAPDWITDIQFVKTDEDGNKSKPIPWLADAIAHLGVFEMTDWPVSSAFDYNEKFRQEFRNHRLYTFCSSKQLDRELTTIYRAARSSQQENGVSSLYLAVGLLRWFEDPDSDMPYYAPLILFPIEIIRKSAHQGYALHARDEEPHFNTTLLEMLRQNYNMEIPGLEPLPADDHGIHIKKVFAIVRSAMLKIPGWDVVESCVVGNFSFAQFAMWNDIHTAGTMLEESKTVRSLMKGHVDWDVSVSENIEDEKVYLPITVDDTQLKAIKMAARGTTFVLHGPPGTGKSQTITGMLANLMAQGKTVLFVAEKMAALSVVQKRLSLLGIGDFCLELHSNKATKKQVLTQLEKALAVKRPEQKSLYDDCLRQATASREKLDGYVEHLHKKQNCGYSLYELIDLYEESRNEERFIAFDSEEAGQLTKEDVQKHLSLIEQLTAAGSVISNIKENYLQGVGLTSYVAGVRNTVKAKAELYESALMVLQECVGSLIACLNQKTPESKSEFTSLFDAARFFTIIKDTDENLLSLLKNDQAEAVEYFNKKDALDKEEQQLCTFWKHDFLEKDMSYYLSKHEAAGKKFFGKASAISALVSEVQGFANRMISFEQIPSLLHAVIQHQQNKQNLQKYYESISEAVKATIRKMPTREEYKEAYDQVLAIRKQAEVFPGGIEFLLELIEKTELADEFRKYVEAYEKADIAGREFNAVLEREDNEEVGDWIRQEMSFCRELIRQPASLKDWSLYNRYRKECLQVGLEPVVRTYEEQQSYSGLVGAYKKGFYYALINYVMNHDDILSGFSGATFNEAIQQFRRLDEQLLQQTKIEIFYCLASKVPTAWDSPEIGKELNLLRKAIGSNARGMSIRTLFERIPHVLQNLCPCMLMSPNSVAQYLTQNSKLFDVVIFDEASQLPTCKAIGALARAKDAVIVGDPKQMPPTTFFAGSGPEVDDLALDDLDSILDDALALGIPSQHLQWHYRSTHESLIAFSNNEFYNNKMYTFPSANDRERHVTAVHVDGVYKNSTNPKEAEAVVEEIIRRYHDPVLKTQSVGVVTFNVKQQTLIENLLAKQFQNDAGLDAWANSGEDPLFVKNLENVQGDERDVILFSVGYGPDEKGRISMNFGPINKQGGGKRLNVAFSRSRVTMTIFSSMYSTDIRVTDSSPEGVVAFRDFLRFAEGHDIGTDMHTTINERTKEGVRQGICKTIEAFGYECVTLVGHSDFHVDIAVIDPFDPNRYMLGIMLDGDGYRQTTNTRDREVAQLGVLKHLGWSLQRIWTIDWWDNRDKVIKKLQNLLEKLKEDAETRSKKLKAEEKNRENTVQNEELQQLKNELEKQATEVIAEEKEAEQEVQERIEIARNRNEEDAVRKSNSVKEQASTVSEKEKVDFLFSKLLEAGAQIIDKRNNGGALWIIGGKDLSSIMKEFQEAGVHFVFKAGGGKATGGKDGWWSKNSIILPAFEEETAEPLKARSSEKELAKETASENIPEHITDVGRSEANVGQEPRRAEDTQGEKEKDTKRSVEETSPDKEEAAMSEEKVSITEPTPYVFAEFPDTKLSPAEYAASENSVELQRRILQILKTEAPILRDVLIRRVMGSFGVTKSSGTLAATEKALKPLKIKQSKYKGDVYCWSPEQDPKTYSQIRYSNERPGNEICHLEIRNAICYALKIKGELTREELIKETSVVLGYKRLGKNLEAILDNSVSYAKNTGAIVSAGRGKLGLP